MIEQDRREAVMAQMALVRAETGCDCCAIGLTDASTHALKWLLASGHTSERCFAITERPGRGLSATVLKVGRAMPLQMSELVCSRQLQEYPLLLAEDLRSAYAAPLYRESAPCGVLIAGDRRKRVYRTDERRLISEAAERIGALLAGKHAARSM